MSTLGVLLVLASVGTSADIELFHFSAEWCGPCRAMAPIVAQLERQGMPVRHVDIDRQSNLAQQFRVESVPCFVLVQDGREVQRIVGTTDYQKLVRLCQCRNSPDLNQRRPLARGQTPPSRLGVRQVTNALTALPRLITQGGTRREEPSRERAEPTEVVSPMSRALAATVRLRIDDATGHSYGTGTIVDVHDNEALVLTCAHIFRASRGKGRITVDLFHSEAPGPLTGNVIAYDLNRDVALVSIRPGISIEPVRVAGKGPTFHPGASVFSIGCDRGGAPELSRGRILAVNRYLGPANLVVSGRPVDGRSGGGLFSETGELIGVCNAADPELNEGLYAAAETVHEELDSAGLGFIYRNARLAVASTDSTRNATPRVPEPRLQLSSAPREPVHEQGSAVPTIRPDNASATEIICIVRPRNQPNGPSEVFVLDRPSQEFFSQLRNEVDRIRVADQRVGNAGRRRTVRAQN